jgi:hypothetical protein
MATNLNVSELDFDKIQTNLKTHLQAQTEFQDYNFDGSNLATLVDALAYATHYNGVYANAAVNESFLDSAQVRNSIVSHAKALGYTPSSATAPSATIRLVFNTATSSVNIDKGTKFSGTYQGTSYNFVTIDAYTATNDTGIYTIDIPISQGEYFTKTYTWLDNTTQRFVLNEVDIDRASIDVAVNGDFWVLNEGELALLDGDSQVFFVQENQDNQTEVYFGPDSGLFGARPLNNNPIIISYVRTKGAASNGTTTFSIPGLVGGFDAQDITITTVDASTLGSDAEEIENIRFRAPKNYERQGRAVTSEDYKAIISDRFGDVQAINVWGGEENDPPKYGKVLIAIKPTVGEELSPITKTKLIDEILKPYNIVAITPEIVDPEYIYVATNSNIKYKKSLTNKSTGELTTVVEAAIEAQFNSDLNEFGSTLRYSGIVASIDNAEASIISNVTTIQMSRRFLKDSTNTAGIYEIQYYNKIIPGTVVSSTIVKTDVADYAIMDDGLGVMTLYNITAQAFENIEMGTVDYTTGKIELNGFLTEIDINQSISIYAAPEDTDISSEKNLLILFDSATIEATPI